MGTTHLFSHSHKSRMLTLLKHTLSLNVLAVNLQSYSKWSADKAQSSAHSLPVSIAHFLRYEQSLTTQSNPSLHIRLFESRWPVHNASLLESAHPKHSKSTFSVQLAAAVPPLCVSAKPVQSHSRTVQLSSTHQLCTAPVQRSDRQLAACSVYHTTILQGKCKHMFDWLRCAEDTHKRKGMVWFQLPLCWFVSIFMSMSSLSPSPSAIISCTLMVCSELLWSLSSWVLRSQCLRLFWTHCSTCLASGKIMASTLKQASHNAQKGITLHGHACVCIQQCAQR